MSTRAEIVDNYFRSKNYYTHIPYEPIGEIMVEEVDRQGENGLYLSTAAALVEQETGAKNLFGCDWGSTWPSVPPYCQVAVTKDRVQKLIANIKAGGGQNGVGLTQLTTINYVYEAEAMGGAHLPRYQMRVGFQVLLDHILNLGWPAGAAAYNAGAGNWRAVINTYGASMARLEREWAARLAGATEPVDPAEPVKPKDKPYAVIYTKTEKQAERIAKRWEERGYEAETGAGEEPEEMSKLDKNVREVVTYAKDLEARGIAYWFWDGGSLDRNVSGRPACVDGPPPPSSTITKMFCADLITLCLRKIGKPVPKNGIYPGGTRSIWLNYGSKMVPFKLSEFREGDVAFIDFNEFTGFEGHVGFSFGGPDDPFSQSYPFSSGFSGLSSRYSLRESHDGGYYTHRLPREAIWG